LRQLNPLNRQVDLYVLKPSIGIIIANRKSTSSSLRRISSLLIGKVPLLPSEGLVQPVSQRIGYHDNWGDNRQMNYCQYSILIIKLDSLQTLKKYFTKKTYGMNCAKPQNWIFYEVCYNINIKLNSRKN